MPPEARHDQSPECPVSHWTGGCFGSAVPVRLLELRTYALCRMLTGVARPCATALENERLQATVCLWRLHFETGH